MARKLTKAIILEPFAQNYHQHYYLRELARVLNTSHQSLKPHLDVLVREKVLLRTKRAAVLEYALSLGEERTLSHLVVAEKERLFQRMEHDELIRVLFEKLSPFFASTIFILFGSAVQGVRKGSDIDLLIVGRRTRVAKVLRDFEEVYNRKVHSLFVTDLTKSTPVFVQEIYHKHIIFNQTETVIRYFWQLYGKNHLV